MPATIGQKVSSGCIRMLNADVIDLYRRVEVGTKIVVLPNRNTVAAIASPARAVPHELRLSNPLLKPTQRHSFSAE
jgi:hypothetical protein